MKYEKNLRKNIGNSVLEYVLRKETTFITKLNNFVYNEGRSVVSLRRMRDVQNDAGHTSFFIDEVFIY